MLWLISVTQERAERFRDMPTLDRRASVGNALVTCNYARVPHCDPNVSAVSVRYDCRDAKGEPVWDKTCGYFFLDDAKTALPIRHGAGLLFNASLPHGTATMVHERERGPQLKGPTCAQSACGLTTRSGRARRPALPSKEPRANPERRQVKVGTLPTVVRESRGIT